MKHRIPRAAGIFVSLLFALNLLPRARATDYLSAGSGPWTNAANWTPNGVPIIGDTARIQGGHAITNTVSNANLPPVTIDAGGNFVLGASATVASIANAGTLTIGNNASARNLNLPGGLTNNGTISTISTTPLHNINFTGTGFWVGSGDLTAIKCAVNVNVNASLDITGLTTPLRLRGSGTIACAMNGTLIAGTQTITANSNPLATLGIGATALIVTANVNGLINGTAGTFNFTTAPTFNAAAGFGFNGVDVQSTFGMPATVGNLTISNASGVNLSAPVTISGQLALDAGPLGTANTTTPTLSSAATVSGPGYVSGPLSRVYAAPGSFTFPTGKAGNPRPVTLNYTALTGGSTVTVEQSETPLGGTLPDATTLFDARHWTISQSGGTGFTFELTLDGTGFTPTATPVILRKAAPALSFTAAAAPPNYTASGISTFGDFALGDFAPSSGQLAFTTAPQTLIAGQLSGLITVQLQSSGGTPQPAVADTTVTLSTTSSGGTFRDVADTTTLIFVTIPAGNSSVSFKYRDIVAPAAPTLTAAGGGVNQAVQSETIEVGPASKLGFTGQPTNGYLGVTLPTVTVQVQDAYGNSLPNGGTNVTLSVNGATLAGGTAVQISDGNGAASFGDLVINTPGTSLSFTASAPGLASSLSGNFSVGSQIIFKAQNTANLDLGSSWVGGTPPGALDTAEIANTSVGTSQNHADLGSSATWFGLVISNWSAGTGYTINGASGGILTLGPGGLTGSGVNHSLALNCGLALGTNQVWDWSGSAGSLNVNGALDTAGATVTFGGDQGINLIGEVGGTGSLIKRGNGSLTWSNSHSFTGSLTISNGTGVVAGSLNGGGAVTVSGGTLAGSGSINGPVQVQAGATLAPGPGIATLTLSGSLTLQPGSVTRMKLNRDGGSNDVVAGASQITYGGTLTVTNVAGTLQLGDSFPLFSAAIMSGNFTNITGVPGNGLVWKFNPALGQLSVASAIPNYPTNLTAFAAGRILNVSWPLTHVGWILQSQTNAQGVSQSPAWFDVPGTEVLNNLAIDIDTNQSGVYYRLRSP